MKKAEFLEVLKARLAVLEASEQQDILDEYAYHIDMRVSGGLSEEQAIRDFGDLDQLVKLIYEAYHVNPDYQPPAPGPEASPVPDAERETEPVYPHIHPGAERLKEALQAIGRWFGQLWAGLGRGVRAVGRWFGGLGRRLAGVFHRHPRPETPSEALPQPAQTGCLPRVSQAAGRAKSGLLRLCEALLRLGWNGLLLLCALPFAAAGVLGLIGAGVLAVLLAQGYPLLGPLLVVAGGLLCCAAILALGTNLIWPKAVSGAADTPQEEETDHEEDE